MHTNKLKELEAARAKITKLEQAIEADRAKELATLPAKFGFSDAAAFIRAFRGATGGGTAGKGKRHKRTVITDEIKGKVKAMTVAGKTGAEISSTVGISLPSVQNIKKELGLTKSRKK